MRVTKMPTYRVSLYVKGRPEGADAREIIAPSPKHAAEAAAGERLIDVGLINQRRASVWEVNRIPVRAFNFYRARTIGERRD